MGAMKVSQATTRRASVLRRVLPWPATAALVAATTSGATAEDNGTIQLARSCKADFDIAIHGGANGVSIRQEGSSNRLRSKQRDGKTLIEIGGPDCAYRITIETVTPAR